MGYIYIVINDINHKVYIGQTSTSLNQRWYEHTRSDINNGSHFHNALLKYGVDKFHMYLLEKCATDKLNEREIYYISIFNSYKNGYNMTPGGAGVAGYKHTDENKLKMSQASKRFWDSLSDTDRQLFIQQRASKLKGVAKSPEHKLALSKARQGKYTGKDNAFYGKHHTQETKDIISKCNTGRISKCRKPVKLIELDKTFSSYTEAWRWLVAQGLCKTKTSQSCNTQIKESIKRNTRAYGYHWEEV